MGQLKTLISPAILALGLSSGTASATIIFSSDPSAVLPGGEINILFEAVEIGTTITGEVDHTGITAVFSSLTGQTLNQVHGQGQADIFNNTNPTGGTVNCATNVNLCLTSMDFHLEGFTFGDFMVDLNFGVGTATIIATDNAGAVFQFELGPGQNFFSLLAIDGQTITDVQVFAPGGFNDFKQPRVSELAPTTTRLPEPGSLALLGSVLGAIGITARKRRE